MKKDLNSFNELPVRYIIDKSGKKTDVIINIQVFKNLMETLEDLYLAVLAEEILATKTEYAQWQVVEKKLAKQKTNVHTKKS